jgi:UDP-N-acetyl-D-glucosamine dehydrogenase
MDFNDTRSLHVAQLTRDALRNMGRPLASAEILVLGASYREDVGDTRYSGSELIVRRLTEMGAELRIHDPYVLHWWEFEEQDEYPASSHGLKRFFRGQEKLKDLRVEQSFERALCGADAVIFAVRHKHYLNLDPDDVVRSAGGPMAVIDCFGILDDEKIKRYFELGCEVKGLGRGHVKRIKDQVREEKAQLLLNLPIQYAEDQR